MLRLIEREVVVLSRLVSQTSREAHEYMPGEQITALLRKLHTVNQ